MLVIALLSLSSCSSEEKEADAEVLRGAFNTQIMTFHPDHKHHLTNRDDVDVATYDLRDPAVRKALDDLYFSCKLGDKFYYICQSISGICRKTDKCVKWKKRLFRSDKCVEREVEIIKTDSHDFLVKSGVHCYSESIYPRGIW